MSFVNTAGFFEAGKIPWHCAGLVLNYGNYIDQVSWFYRIILDSPSHVIFVPHEPDLQERHLLMLFAEYQKHT
jgi:hypothetical protein